MSIDHHL